MIKLHMQLGTHTFIVFSQKSLITLQRNCNPLLAHSSLNDGKEAITVDVEQPPTIR